MSSYTKKYFIRKVIPALFILFFVMVGIIKVDIINTKCLSPLGNTKENYELISKEFGDDFSNFIKDNSFLKIYKEKDSNILIRLGNEDFKINDESTFFYNIKETFKNIKNKINGAKSTMDKVV